MWSFFSRDPVKDFAYEIGDKIAGLEEKSLWVLHEGKRKSNGEPVSIFVFNGKTGNETQVQVVKSCFKRFKTLRHPNVLTYLDGLETEKSCYVVTEPVIPLSNHLQSHQDSDDALSEIAISWGLHQTVKALAFLINDCNLIHNNVCVASVFVDRAGEWKLGGFDYMYPASGAESIPPIKIQPALEKYDAPEKTTKKASEKWSTDMWCLGCLIWEVFNGSFSKTAQMKNIGKIPKILVPNYCELVGANPKSRPNPNKFIENCRAKGGFMDNKFVATMLFLEEIQIQDQEAKSQFFNSLPSMIDSFPPSSCKQKILPQLLHAFEYGNAGSAVLSPLFKLGKLLDSDEYQKKIVPCVVKLFSSTDRATRVKLLQQIEQFVEHLTPTVVNDQIFPSLVTGFIDSNPVVREQTIKSMLHLASKLNYKNLNEELLKHFARLQAKDDQGGIRTNTTVCLGKIACHLHPQVRQRVLSSACLRAMKDPFPPARQAGVLAMAATHNFFTLQESAQRLLPALCTLATDPDKGVRDQAFRAIKCFLGKLEKVSENPELAAEAERDVHIGGAASASSAGWTGWAVSGMSSLTSKIYRGKPRGQAKTPADSSAPVKVGDDSKENTPPPKSTPTPAQVKLTRNVEQNPVAAPIVDDDGGDDDGERDGWEDEDWGDMEENDNLGGDSDKRGNSGDGWDDDGDWANMEDTSDHMKKTDQKKEIISDSEFVPTKDHLPASSYNWGQSKAAGQDDEFFSSILTKDNKKKPSSLSSSNAQPKSNPAPLGQPSKLSSVASPTEEKHVSSAAKPVSSTSNRSQSKTTKEADGWGDSEWGELEDWSSDSFQNKGKSKVGQQSKTLNPTKVDSSSGKRAMKLTSKKPDPDEW